MLEAILTKAFLAKASVVLAGLSVATTSAGAADVLPQVAQDRVATAVEKVSPLDLPDSQDPVGGAEGSESEEEAVEAPKPEEAEEAEDAAKPEKAEKPGKVDNFGSIVSARARSDEEKGKEFGQSVSAEARARAAARQEAKPRRDADEDADETDDGEGEGVSSTAKGHRPSDTTTAQGKRGSGARP